MDFNSSRYWQDRYSKGGDSGSGSKFHLAKFKSKTIASLISKHKIKTIGELGCGDGLQIQEMLPFFIDRGLQKYTGFDIAFFMIQKLKDRFENVQGFEFKTMAQLEGKFDMTMSLDVIYHLVEDDVFERYMKQLFEHSSKYVLIYSSNDKDNEESAAWVRHRMFTNWIEKNRKDFELVEVIKNPWPYKKGMKPRYARNSSVSDFYLFEKKS